MTSHTGDEFKNFVERNLKGQTPMFTVNMVQPDLKYILSALPIFGGEDPVTETADPAKTETNTSASEDDPIVKLQSDPKALQDLLAQTQTLASQVQALTKENTTYTQEKEKQERLTKSNEENLQKDLENANALIEQQDRVIEAVAVENAFIHASGKTQWHNVKDAISKLNEENYSVEIDLDNSKASVTGLDKEVQRIAKENSYLVKAAGTEETEQQPQQRGPGRPRTTGTPPTAPKGNEVKKARREELMSRHPVLMQR